MSNTSDLAFYKQVLEAAAVPIFAINKNHEVIIWNAACARMTGVSAEEVLNLPRAWRGFYAEPRTTLADLVLDGQLQDMIQFYPTHRNSPFSEQGIQAESWLPNVGGTTRYLLFDATPILNDKNEIIAVIETIHDISTRQKLETELRRSQANALTRTRELDALYSQVEKARMEWETTLNCLHDLVLLVDSQGRIRQCNRSVADLLNRDYFGLIGCKWQELILDPEIMDLSELADGQGEIKYKPTGRWFLLRSYPIEGGATGISGTVITLHDLTEIKEMSKTIQVSCPDNQE